MTQTGKTFRSELSVTTLKSSDQPAGKITLGISVYGQSVPPRDVQKCGLMLKKALKDRDGSLRLVPNETTSLSTATSHHNKLGLAANKIEIIVVFAERKVYIAESLGAQNITSLAARDQGRPKRDAFVGMLPPKLALMMINLAAGVGTSFSEDSDWPSERAQELGKSDGVRAGQKKKTVASTPDDVAEKANRIVLDPFCGTGVILQEAALLGYDVYGTDLAEKMIDYSKQNLEWLAQKHPIGNVRIEHGDAIEHSWQSPINAVVSETYLGQPFSAPPAPDKLTKVVRITNEIITKFLQNIHAQLEPGTPLCLAVPAWRDANGRFTNLPLTDRLPELGYDFQHLLSVDVKKLVYYREDQVVARQLLILKCS